MRKGSWWQRSLDRHSRLLETRCNLALRQRRNIEGKGVFGMAGRSRNKHEFVAYENVVYVDALERRKTAKDLMWKAKWDARKAKLNASKKKQLAIARQSQ
jgi:hypothetical protein